MTNTEFISKWIEALESGTYNQGKYKLRTVGKDGSSNYCCLGVACELLVKSNIGNWNEEGLYYEIPLQGTPNNTGYQQSSVSIPVILHKILGFKRPGGIHTATFMDWNDTDDLSFAEIAKKIRENYEKYPLEERELSESEIRLSTDI